jgi:hypothetical protein
MNAFAAMPVRIARHGKSARAILLAALCIGARGWNSSGADAHSFTCGVEPGINGPALVADEPVSTLGIQKLLFIRVRFPDDTADPITLHEAETTLRAVDTAFRRMSHDAFGLTSTVSTVVHLRSQRNDYAELGGFDKFIDGARQAAAEAGFDYRDYDLDVVRHTGVPGFMGGNARLGTRGAQVQVGGVVILLHELGHNLGLSHANFWETSGPGISLGSPPLPSNYPSLPDPRSIAVHPDSLFGHDTVTGPGVPAEYGDFWDIMGSGDSDFSASYKRYLKWLPNSSSITAPAGRSMHRIHSLATVASENDLLRSIRIRSAALIANSPSDYAIELPSTRNGLASPPGVLVRWVNPVDHPSGSLLLDGTPGSIQVNGDAILPMGRTFSDRIAGIHVTPVTLGAEDASMWADIVVYSGHRQTNLPPTATLTASAEHVATGEFVQLTAQGVDPDGDELAWFWDFGDGTPGTNTPVLTKSWRRSGDFVVRVEVSDMRGGVAHARVLLRVGETSTLRASGIVRDSQGQPIAGARVHDGIGSSERPGRPRVQTWTDSSGAYTLTGLEPDSYSVSAFHPDYIFDRLPPVTLEDDDLIGHDLTGTALTRVVVSGPGEVPEAIGFTNLFTFTRHGPTNEPLTVLFRFGGTASASGDYIAPLQDRVVIPAGSTSVSLELPILDDSVGEDTETIGLTVAYPVRSSRFDAQGNEFFVFYPGWETIMSEGVLRWTHTRPEYIPVAGSFTEVVIVDDDEATEHVVSISASGVIALEEPLVETTFEISRAGNTSLPLMVDLEVAGTAKPGSDYEPLPASVSFVPDETFRVITVRPVPDDVEEPEETVVLRVLPGEHYGIAGEFASVSIRDRLVYPQDLRVSLGVDKRFSIVMRARPGSRLVLEGSTDFEHWDPIRTNLLFNADTATVTLPNAMEYHFFRTLRPE